MSSAASANHDATVKQIANIHNTFFILFVKLGKIFYELHSGINCHTALFTSAKDDAILDTFSCNAVNLLLIK
jgi:hypothetical protein